MLVRHGAQYMIDTHYRFPFVYTRKSCSSCVLCSLVQYLVRTVDCVLDYLPLPLSTKLVQAEQLGADYNISPKMLCRCHMHFVPCVRLNKQFKWYFLQ